MISTRRHRAFGAMPGWWATAARALALVLALAVAAPTAGLAGDFASHRGGHAHERTALAMAPDATSDGMQAVEHGLGCHVQCGCHVAVHQDDAALMPLPVASRRSYDRLSETVTSVSPDRLPRPPRA
ncbi:hypothetical protein [uncultured Methylobacterium sp.]|uniref:hypothetical protein n=1 Tax=uncultured Methylobacterium sp. TaxID=157278 RepID=UPI0035CA9978